MHVWPRVGDEIVALQVGPRIEDRVLAVLCESLDESPLFAVHASNVMEAIPASTALDDTYADKAVGRTLQSLGGGWATHCFSVLSVCEGPAVGTYAVGVGSNVKKRTRAARVALVATLAIREQWAVSTWLAPLVSQAEAALSAVSECEEVPKPAVAVPQPPLLCLRSDEELSQATSKTEETPSTSVGSQTCQEATTPRFCSQVGQIDPNAPRACVEDPHSELRSWPGSPEYLWPWCRLCNCWNDMSHLKGRRHQRAINMSSWTPGVEDSTSLSGDVEPSSVASVPGSILALTDPDRAAAPLAQAVAELLSSPSCTGFQASAESPRQVSGVAARTRRPSPVKSVPPPPPPPPPLPRNHRTGHGSLLTRHLTRELPPEHSRMPTYTRSQMRPRDEYDENPYAGVLVWPPPPGVDDEDVPPPPPPRKKHEQVPVDVAHRTPPPEVSSGVSRRVLQRPPSSSPPLPPNQTRVDSILGRQPQRPQETEALPSCRWRLAELAMAVTARAMVNRSATDTDWVVRADSVRQEAGTVLV